MLDQTDDFFSTQPKLGICCKIQIEHEFIVCKKGINGVNFRIMLSRTHMIAGHTIMAFQINFFLLESPIV